MKKEISGLTYSSLESLIKQLDELGIDKKNYNEITFEPDYSSCYYESDSPCVKVVIDIK